MPAESNNPESPTKLIWIDLEMTGLDTTSDHIIEIATIVTDMQLNEVAEGPVIAIRQSREVMDAMDEWNTRHHGESGLTARVLESDRNAQQAEMETLDFLRQHVRKQHMSGPSIPRPANAYA